jgi:dihydroorotate dehydrogenase (fumarate)
MDLATAYLGLPLKNPLIASASPLTGTLDGLCRIEDGGAAAVVLPSIFEEQIEAESRELERVSALAEGLAEANGFFPAGSLPQAGPHQQLDLIRKARAALGIPVIASLNGTTEGGWIAYAKLAEQAGARAIELNVYFPSTDPALDSAEVERRPFAILHAVKRSVAIPVGMKLMRDYSAPGALIRRLDAAGADGFALFNRLYQPDIDLLTLRPVLTPALSTAAEIRPGLMWIAALAGTLRASLAASTGVETEAEVVKYLLAGADAVMTTAALLRHGPNHLQTMLAGLARWGEARGFASVAAFKGRMSRAMLGSVAGDDRFSYSRILQGYATPF